MTARRERRGGDGWPFTCRSAAWSVPPTADPFLVNGVRQKKLFQYRFRIGCWGNIHNFVKNIAKLPLWVSHEMSLTVFGGKLNYAAWESIFEKGTSPSGQKVLAEPLNLIKLIQA